MNKEFEDRYVITGMGLVSPVGNNVEEAWDNLMAGRHGVQNIRDTHLKGYDSLPVGVGAPVKDFNLLDDPDFLEHKKKIRVWDTSQQYALFAGAQALRQAGLIKPGSLKIDKSQHNPNAFGVFVGTGIGGGNAVGEAQYLLETERLRIAEGEEDLIARSRLRPSEILKALPGRVAATPSLVFGAKAFWKGLLQECASGNGAIISAVEAIKLGKADVVLAGGTEGEITPTNIGLFGAAGAVSKNQDPESASRPFDRDRDGLVMGAGAGMLVVESYDHAQMRGAPILAEIVGYAENADAKYETEPDPESVLIAINKALLMAQTRGYGIRNVSVNAHATSTQIGDSAEMKSIAHAFEDFELTGITSTKSATGHTLGAAGAIEAVFSIKSLQEGKVPPNLNLENPIEEAKGYEHLFNKDRPIEGQVDLAVNNSFGFGGNNAITIFARPR